MSNQRDEEAVEKVAEDYPDGPNFYELAEEGLVKVGTDGKWTLTDDGTDKAADILSAMEPQQRLLVQTYFAGLYTVPGNDAV